MRIAAVILLLAVSAAATSPAFAQATASSSYSAPGEFEPQEYIWLSWIEQGWLGGAPFSDVALDVMRAVTPHVRVRLMFSAFTSQDTSYRGPYALTPEQAERRLRERLEREGVDLSRVDLFYYPQPYGAIQDPGPFFLRSPEGRLALADFGFDHPDPRTESIDREIAARLKLPTVRSSIVSEGGGRQANGRGTLLLVESVELARNPKLTRDEIEAEHRRVHGTPNVIWLKRGPADEDWGRLPDGRWGIGTGGHVDVFARFADARTILLAEVSEAERDSHPILRATYERMEENFRILSAARDEEGRPFRIIRVPVPDPMTATRSYDSMSPAERSWFEGAKAGDTIEFYLPAGYLNFIIANGVVVTGRFWKEGMAASQRDKDERAREVLEQAFPGRQIVQVDALPLVYDGAGLHCHARNQPFASIMSWPGLATAESSTVYVLDDTGAETSGTLLRLNPDWLVLRVGDTERRFDAARVRRIEKRGDSLRNGAVIGAIVGAAVGVLAAGISDCPGDDPGGSCPGFRAAGFLLSTGAYAAIGTGIDALVVGRTTLYEAPAASPRPARMPNRGRIAFNMAFRW